MSQIDDGGSAFPVYVPEGPLLADGSPEHPAYTKPGMSLRDWLAGRASEQDIEHHMAMGYVAGRIIVRTREQAKYAYADAMIAARKRGDQ